MPKLILTFREALIIDEALAKAIEQASNENRTYDLEELRATRSKINQQLNQQV
jgi:hypothetical protein